MTFDISMGVRKGNDALKAGVDRALVSQRDAIGQILERFGVPRVGTWRCPGQGIETGRRKASEPQLHPERG